MNFITLMMESQHKKKTEDEEPRNSKSLVFGRDLLRNLDRGPKSLDSPRQIVVKKYSLEPDMVGGWKPRKIDKNKNNRRKPFVIRYENKHIDKILSHFKKTSFPSFSKLVYIGPRKQCSSTLHEDRSYPNPYCLRNSSLGNNLSKSHHSDSVTLSPCHLLFDSDFEGGNLDIAIMKDQCQFDLFMRVDTNTKGHTNWYYFSVRNKEWTGKVKFNICNFRREISLYQSGLKPFIFSQCSGQSWRQGGQNISYSKVKFPFFSTDDIPNKWFQLSFTHNFQRENDEVKFSYGIPYLYSQLLTFLDTLDKTEKLEPLKSLTGLDIPVLKITEKDEEQVGDSKNKQVVMLTARVHPGESNSSYVMEGLLSYLTKDIPEAEKLRKKYIFYVVPMINPDGVVAGNYRTSLFGKDLNRTYNLSRRYAFPETYQLQNLVKRLKSLHKKKFVLYLDLHGHSSKKNVFMYGPDYSLQHINFEMARILPKLMSKTQESFRYYSCSFRIAEKKMSTSRAIFNHIHDIPFTYTMQSSNGVYFDYDKKENRYFTSQKWKEVGVSLCQALQMLDIDKQKRHRRKNIEKESWINTEIKEKEEEKEREVQEEDNSDCDDSQDDLSEALLQELENSISQGKPRNETNSKNIETFSEQKLVNICVQSPTKKTQIQQKQEKKELPSPKKQQKKDYFLPHIFRQKASETPLFRSRKQKTLSLQPSSKRYVPPPSNEVNYLEKDFRPVIVIHEMSQDYKKKDMRCLNRAPSQREKVIQALKERLKTIK